MDIFEYLDSLAQKKEISAENPNEVLKRKTDELVAASEAYYGGSTSMMDNFTFDLKLSELEVLENELGYALPNSPTKEVEPEISSRLKTVKHKFPMLSLDKSKDIADIRKFAKGHALCASIKCDGLTGVLTIDGEGNTFMVSRGNGYEGKELITLPIMDGIPKEKNMGKMVIRGEICMTYADFDALNEDGQYDNARNLAAGTALAEKMEKVRNRKLTFIAFDLLEVEGYKENSFSKRLDYLESLGFIPVEHRLIDEPDSEELDTFIADFTAKVTDGYFIPADGLVFMIDDKEYASLLPDKQKKSGKGFAFKWQDEAIETTLTDIEFQVSKNGILTPVGIFDTVRIEGSDVGRASLCNISEMKRLGVAIGKKVSVIKSNMIIPKIVNVTDGVKPNEVTYPSVCPVCGAKTMIKMGKDDKTETLVCTNLSCFGRQIGKLEHFVSKDAMNIDGLAIRQLEDLVNHGFIKSRADIYTEISIHKEEIANLNGWGEKSVSKLLTAIENSRHTNLQRFLYSLSIPTVGQDVTKKLHKLTDGKLEKLLELCQEHFDFTKLPDIGDTISCNINDWYKNTIQSDSPENEEFNLLRSLLELEERTHTDVKPVLEGFTFVVTGGVNHFENRKKLQEFIEERGGKLSGSVSARCNYLINNDVTSTTGKNKAAKENNVPIISEEEFLNLVESLN